MATDTPIPTPQGQAPTPPPDASVPKAGTSIVVRNIGKAYRIWASPSQRLISPGLSASAGLLGPLGAPLQKAAARGYRDFHALQGINFEVHQGEAVGIVGRNGSGKSTLLQIIAGTLQPTAGSVQLSGRVAALLELGSGFNPQFTGRENVYLSGAVLGLSKRIIDERFDEIAAFADIGEFIEEPVKTYSSGMTVRLAFAVCAHVDADVLIIDEALGVGDARFQLKCARTIDRFIAEGRTLLFVSHDLNSVKRLCNRAILLEGGKALYTGSPNTVVNLYSKLMASNAGAAAIAADLAELGKAPEEKTPGAALPPPTPPSAPASPAVSPAVLAQWEARWAKLDQQMQALAEAARPDPRAQKLAASEASGQKASSGEYAYGGELGQIAERCMVGEDSREKTVFTSGEAVTVRLKVQAAELITDPIFAMTIKTRQGQEVYGTNTLYLKQPTPTFRPGDHATVTFKFPLNLVAGEYFLSLGWTKFVGEELMVIHRRYDTVKFTVLGVDRCFGIAHLFATIDVSPVPAVR